MEHYATPDISPLRELFHKPILPRHGLGFRLHPAQSAALGGGPGDGPCLPGVAALESRRALANIHRDVGVSGSTGIQGHQLDGRLAGGDTSSADCPERVEEQQSPMATTDRF